MTYDNAGNTQQRTINGVATDFTFNSENQFGTATVHAAGGDQQTNHLYDATGGQLIRKDPTGTTLYAAGQEYKAVGSTVTATRYYTHGGATVAVRNGTGTYRLAADHQASANLTVNTGTGAVQRRWYTPYGDDRVSQGTWPTERGFLNKQTNTSTALIDVGAREYDPKLGTFISPDPLVNPADPATLNAYAYAGHSPISKSDPSGLAYDAGVACSWLLCYPNQVPANDPLGPVNKVIDNIGYHAAAPAVGIFKAVHTIYNDVKDMVTGKVSVTTGLWNLTKHIIQGASDVVWGTTPFGGIDTALDTANDVLDAYDAFSKGNASDGFAILAGTGTSIAMAVLPPPIPKMPSLKPRRTKVAECGCGGPNHSPQGEWGSYYRLEDEGYTNIYAQVHFINSAGEPFIVDFVARNPAGEWEAIDAKVGKVKLSDAQMLGYEELTLNGTGARLDDDSLTTHRMVRGSIVKMQVVLDFWRCGWGCHG